MSNSRMTHLSVMSLMSLGLIGILGPFGTDIYLPALPQINAELGGTESDVRFTISAYTLGMALGQLFIGSLSDRIGRRPLMLSGGIAVAIMSILASISGTILNLVICCFLLGVGSAAGLVTGRAVVADTTSGKESVKYFSLLQMFVSTGPILGPLVGALILMWGSWRLVFIALSVVALLGALMVYVFTRESLASTQTQEVQGSAFITNVKKIMCNTIFLTNAATLWLSFGMLFVYVSTSSFVLQNSLHLTEIGFAIDFALNGCGLVLASLFSARLVKRVKAVHLVRSGLVIQIVGIGLLAITAATSQLSMLAVGIGFFLLTTSMGFILGPTTALAVEQVRFASGTALALMGSIQFAMAGFSTALTALLFADPLVALVSIGSVLSVLAALSGFLGTHLVNTSKSKSLELVS